MRRPVTCLPATWKLLTCLVCLPAGIANGQTAEHEPTGAAALQAVDTSLGLQYRAGGVHRFLFGTRYRGLWTTPVRVPVLDLRTEAGGLRPVTPPDPAATGSLRLVAADGREYLLRPIGPYSGEELRPELRGGIVERLFKDQLSAVHPFGPLVADHLGGAIGLPRLSPRLVLVPHDTPLGELREGFAGLLGYLQDRPAPGFAGFREVVGTEALLRLRRERQAHVDAPRYLAARLLDLLVGDWDRIRGQWRWGRTGGGEPWQPIPRDRDHVFSDSDGLLLAVARGGPAPQLVRFGEGRLPVMGLTWYSRDLDRELLTGLEWTTWDSTVRAVEIRLDDAAIDSAAAAMPAAVTQDVRDRLARTLRARRARLGDAARRFYLLLAAEADLHGTDAAERITVTGTPNGAVRVELRGADSVPSVRRQFEPSETGEVRVFAHGGADTVVTRGEAGRVRVRVIGGKGDDVASRPSGPDVRLYQEGADWRPIPQENDPPLPPDWGGRTTFLPIVGANSDAGLILGLNLTHTDYGFRKLPFASRTSVKTALGTTSMRPGIIATTSVQTGLPAIDLVLSAKATGVEVLRLYDPGNESGEADDRDFHTARNWQFELAPSLELTLTDRVVLGAGPRVRYMRSESASDRLIGRLQPYGAGGFGSFGARAYGRLDFRDLPTNPRRGFVLEIGGELVPAAWDVVERYGSAYATLGTYISAPVGWSPILHLRAGARRVWGRYPYFDAARVGGGNSLRGYSTGRFMGDAAVFGQAEVRVPVSPATILVPGTLGLMGLADVGRVYFEGEDSELWHAGVGGGIWFTWLGGSKIASLAVARGSERTTLTVRVGSAF